MPVVLEAGREEDDPALLAEAPHTYPRQAAVTTFQRLQLQEEIRPPRRVSLVAQNGDVVAAMFSELELYLDDVLPAGCPEVVAYCSGLHHAQPRVRRDGEQALAFAVAAVAEGPVWRGVALAIPRPGS
jgi:hypothetical protein